MAYAASGVQGSKVQWKNTTGGVTTLTDIPGVLSFEESAEDADTIDVTPINASSESTLSGFAKPGSATMQLAYDPTDTVHKAIRACAVGTGTAKTGDLKQFFNDKTTPSTRAWTAASVQKFEVKLSAKAALIANVSFKLNGTPTDTDGS
jgi:hypothetical protein